MELDGFGKLFGSLKLGCLRFPTVFGKCLGLLNYINRMERCLDCFRLINLNTSDSALSNREGGVFETL